MVDAELNVRSEIRSGPNRVTRSLIWTDGYGLGNGPLVTRGFDFSLEWVRSGGSQTDYAGRVITERNAAHKDEFALGVSVVTTETRERTLPSGRIQRLTPKSQTVNHWVGDNVRLLTPVEADAVEVTDGKTALDLATVGGIRPEMVVHARNGRYFPAGKNDVVVPFGTPQTDK